MVGSSVWVMVVDRRAGMKWVVGRGSAAKVDRWSLVVVRSWSWLGRGWVVAEVAPVMIFFEWVCSDGFQICWVSNRRCGFLIGVGLMVCVCVCG